MNNLIIGYSALILCLATFRTIDNYYNRLMK